MDLSIPPGLPPDIVEQLSVLKHEFSDGYLTEKGYIKKRVSILSSVQSNNTQASIQSTIPPQINSPLSNSMNSPSNDGFTISDSTTSSHHRAYSVTSGITRRSSLESKRLVRDSQPPSLNVELQKPLDPRKFGDITTDANFETLASILRHRGSTYQRENAIIIVDSKGKESVTITWEKLYLKAEKVAQQIRDKSGLYKNDRVCLIYQNVEVVEFTIALFGCFLAGVVAVPITLDMRITEMISIMTVTQSHLCLTSETVMKYLDKKVTPHSKLKWPKGLEFWKTTSFGAYHAPKKNDPPILQIPDLAYIEFVKSPDGELNGVAISHKTIMKQMNVLTSILSSNPDYEGKSYKRKDLSFTRHRNVMLNILDSRKSVGLIVGTLLNVFSGNLMIWTPSSLLDIAGLYANIITKFGVTVLLNDYLSLKQVVYNYQSFPQYTRKFSKQKVDFSKLKWVLIYTSIVDGEFHEILTNRWLKPLGCKNVENVVAPLLTLNEFGGMVISMRDWLGEEEKLNTPILPQIIDDIEDTSNNLSSLSEVLIDKQSLTTNTVKVISDRPPPITENYRTTDFLRIGSFGFPLPDATLAIVNPETCYLAGVMQVGEIWIDSVSLPGGFWGTPEGTHDIFHARCRDHEGVLNLEFLRTGLLGFTYNGKVYVLGLYEDRLRQRITHIDREPTDKYNPNEIEYKYHYSDHIAYTLARAIPQKRVSDSSAFDVLFNGEYLPVVVIESPAAVPDEKGSVDIPELDMIATKSFTVLERYHNVRPYCILILPPDALPRTIKSGIPGIANMLCKRNFLEGNLRSVYVKYNIKRSITEVPRSTYYLNSIWSDSVSNYRYQSLKNAEDQYSGLDFHDTVIDDRTKKLLSDFKNILEILEWRVKYQADELAFSTITKAGNKQLSWKKFENKVAGIISMILNKMAKGKLKPRDRIGLMYTLSDDFSASLYACWYTGLIPIPLNPVDPNRVAEDISSLVDTIKDYKIANIFVNSEVEGLIKNKPIAHSFKEMPSLATMKIRNTSKTTTKNSLSSFLPTIEKKLAKSNITNDSISLILLNFTDDNVRVGVGLTMNRISALCKIFKQTCQVESKSPLISCVRHTSGIGFVQSALIGIYVGSSTYILPPLEFATNPALFFLSLSRFKVKDVYVTQQMLEYAMKRIKNPEFSLERAKNLIVGCEGRPNVNLIKNVATRFSATKLSSSSINHVYSHFFNPIIALRSYLSFDPIDLYIDADYLRLGLISIVNPSAPNSIHLQDSGIVPVCTQIAIVNPETRKLCKVGEYGEIWVCSEGNVEESIHKYGQANDFYDASQFGAKISGGSDDSLTYIRTADFGFLHNVSRTEKGATVEYQPLYVLGPIANTFESMGLMHFAVDIENSIESSHSDIKYGGSCIFKIDGFIVVVVDTIRAKYLSSLVPVIFNKVLSQHNLIIDIVAFTKPNGFPYSRLGLKRRAKILSDFSSKKLKIQAQYGLNYGEGSLIKTVQEFEENSKLDPIKSKMISMSLSESSSNDV